MCPAIPQGRADSPCEGHELVHGIVRDGDGIDAEHDQAGVNQAEQQHGRAGDGRTADAWRTRVAAFHLFLSVIHHASLFVSVTVRFFSAALTASLTVLVMSDGFAPTDFARASSAAVWAFSYAVVLACT